MATQMPIPQEFDRFVDPVEFEEENEPDTSIDDLFSPDEDTEIEELPDGSAVVKLENDESSPNENPDFYENLADSIPVYELTTIAANYLDLIDKDKDARSERDKQYEEGIRRSGLGNDAPGGASFNGASKVVHPVLSESSIDFAARAIKELFPPDGPVKTRILGSTDDEKREVAERKRDFMNWQFTQQIEEFRDEQEQMLTQLPFGGSQYIKLWYDEEMRRPRAEFIPIDNIYLPFAAVNFYTASRVTEVDDITQDVMDQRIASGLYRDINFVRTSMEPEPSKTAKANQRIEGKSDDGTNPDGIRRTYNVYTWMSLESDTFSEGKRAPYILMLDEQTQDVLAIYRNWDPEDDRMRKLDHIIEFKFIPWRGAYAIGFPHLIGGLSAALTGALRALLDSAHINNAATMLKLKGAKISGQSTQVEVTQVAEIEGAPGVDDIRKIAMPMPFNPPSGVLFELMGWLTTAAKGVVTTASEKVSEINSNAPVGTTQAIIEQGAVVFSAIHARLHNSQMRLMKVLSRINRWYLPEMDCDEIIEEIPVTTEDFEVDSDVVPVSDPNIFSDMQRFAQAQALAARAKENPDLYDRRVVEQRLLKTMKIPNVQEIVPDPSKVEDMNPALENVAMTLGKPVGAFPNQDHMAHIQVHMDYATDPVFGGNPSMAPSFQPAVIEHIKQHMVLWYLNSMKEAAGFDVFKPERLPNGLQVLLTQAGQQVKAQSMQTFQATMQALVPMMQMAAQAAQQRGPQLPDPQAQAILQASLAETERKKMRDQADIGLDQARLQQDAQESAAKLQQSAQQNTEDNLTKERIATATLTAKDAELRQKQIDTVLNAQRELNQPRVPPQGVR